ncbi:MAG: amidase [bacterium]|jgi:amidase
MNGIVDTDHQQSDSTERRDAVLEVAGLHAGYGDIPVLRGVSFELLAGEAIGLVGHNGSGKTTLLKTLLGLINASSGRISIDGDDMTRSPAHERARIGIGYVPQGRGILPAFSALENLRLAWSAETGETEQQSLDRVLTYFPRLTSILDRKGDTLSGGEQQILALGRSMMPAPWLLLLDEPSEGIQPSIVEEIGQVLSQLHRQQNLSLIIVEQNLDLVLDVADRVLVFERGNIEREFATSQLQSGALTELLGMGTGRLTRANAHAVQERDTTLRNPAVNNHSSLSERSTHEHHNQSGAASKVDVVKTFAGTAALDRHSPMEQLSTHSYKASAVNSHKIAASGRLTKDVSRDQPLTPSTLSGNNMATVKRPTLEQMKGIVTSLHMNMSEREVGEYLSVLEDTFKNYDRVAQLPNNLPEVRYPRTPGYRPSGDENTLNAWAVKSEVHGAAHGPMSGKRVVLKDNVCLAGVPLMNGSSTLEGYVPDVDATIVTRMLDAGATIVGKAHCEFFCLSGGSHTSAMGPVHNPYRYGYAAGGSSSGSAALVGSGEVEMAIGGDQGGSIRMPSGWCGIYGMKPTHGLVPYTGVMPIEATIDHTGPMTANVADNALMLEVIAGADGLDPRQYDVRVDKYTSALGRGVSGLRIGVVSEGFGHANSEADVDASVRSAAEKFRKLGAAVDEISIPMHLDGLAIWTPIALEGLQAQMMHGNGMGFNWEGMYTTSLLDAHSNWRSRADELSRTLKISMLAGEYFIKHHRGHFYAKAQNLGRLLRKRYDEALSQYDLLLMPTLPMKATPIPPQDAPLALYCQRGFEMLGNTAPFDVSGHPAMSVPCGLSQGLPVGMMLIAGRYEESSIYRAAHAFEQLGDWREM